jgi:hypothetical protein
VLRQARCLHGYDNKMIIHALGKILNRTFNPHVENSEKIKSLIVTVKGKKYKSYYDPGEDSKTIK